jgi:hypothetical protein
MSTYKNRGKKNLVVSVSACSVAVGIFSRAVKVASLWFGWRWTRRAEVRIHIRGLFGIMISM